MESKSSRLFFLLHHLLLVIGIGSEVIFGLSHIETPGSKGVISTVRFRWSTVGLNLNPTNGTTICWSSISRLIRQSVWERVGHGQNSTDAGHQDKCQKLHGAM